MGQFKSILYKIITVGALQVMGCETITQSDAQSRPPFLASGQEELLGTLVRTYA